MKYLFLLFLIASSVVFCEWIEVEGIPVYEKPPLFDGRREGLWDLSKGFVFDGKVRSLSLMVWRGNLEILIGMDRSATGYIGKSLYLDVHLGRTCEDGVFLRVPFKIWNGRAYLFETRGGKPRISGFVGIGLGEYLEFSIPFSPEGKSEMCVVLKDSRTLEILERHDLVLYSLETNGSGR